MHFSVVINLIYIYEIEFQLLHPSIFSCIECCGPFKGSKSKVGCIIFNATSSEIERIRDEPRYTYGIHLPT
jgi:hypothetical protein